MPAAQTVEWKSGLRALNNLKFNQILFKAWSYKARFHPFSTPPVFRFKNAFGFFLSKLLRKSFKAIRF